MNLVNPACPQNDSWEGGREERARERERPTERVLDVSTSARSGTDPATMAKKASGKRLTIRSPGRRRFPTGPRPKDKGKDKDKDKMVKKAKHFSDKDNLIKKAFQGWKDLHYRQHYLHYLVGSNPNDHDLRVASCEGGVL